MSFSIVRRWPAVSSPRTLHASKFVGFASHLRHTDHVTCFLALLAPSLKRASHLMWAYRAPAGSGAHDGGEHGAGARLERLLELRREQSVIVVVARWYGGVRLGSDRWKCISDVAKQALDRLEPPPT